MASRRRITVDGNEAAASVAYRASETIAIYPITPSSPMAEVCDEWASRRKPNLWGAVPELAEMQSEGGAAGAVHGALQAGALVDDVHGVAGPAADDPEHVQDRRRADAVRRCTWRRARWRRTRCRSSATTPTSWPAARPASRSCARTRCRKRTTWPPIAHAATLETRIPFLHFFDGFRTSHEVAKIEELSDDDLRALIAETAVYAHRQPRAHARSAGAARHRAEPRRVLPGARGAPTASTTPARRSSSATMQTFAELTGRRYGLFDTSATRPPSA